MDPAEKGPSVSLRSNHSLQRTARVRLRSRIRRAPRIWNLFDQAPGKSLPGKFKKDDSRWMRCRHLKRLRCAVATDGEIASTENPETSFATCPYLRTQQASCDELKRSYDEGFRAGKEIIAAEFRTRSELNQPYVWKPPMISEVDLPARVVNGVMIPAHRELVIVRPGYWVRADNVLKDQ